MSDENRKRSSRKAIFAFTSMKIPATTPRSK